MYSTKRPPLHQTEFPNLSVFLVNRGKVRDMYDVPEHPDKLLMVATDRISAYDVVMNDPIGGKGKVLTSLTLMWLGYLTDIIPNHLITSDVSQYPESLREYEEDLWGRSMLVKKLLPLPAECIVRGYISGSMWGAYKKAKSVRGIKTLLGFDLRDNMLESEQFDESLFTPSTKARLGEKDENISFGQMIEIFRTFLAEHDFDQIEATSLAHKVSEVCVDLYEKASAYARERGIIIADTKFELALDPDGNLVLIDEVLTPDSSRFWPADKYEIGRGQESYDKQFLRDYLSSLDDWDKNPPAPELPLKIINGTIDRYQDAETILCN